CACDTHCSCTLTLVRAAVVAAGAWLHAAAPMATIARTASAAKNLRLDRVMLTLPPPAALLRMGARHPSVPESLRLGNALGGVPRNHQALRDERAQVHRDSGAGGDGDRRPCDVEPEPARALDDHPAEDVVGATEVLRDDGA